MAWLHKLKTDTRTPLNSRKDTIGHLRALVASQNGQIASLETRLIMIDTHTKELMLMAQQINKRINDIVKDSL